jgi:hypothetical protein
MCHSSASNKKTKLITRERQAGLSRCEAGCPYMTPERGGGGIARYYT